MTSSFGIRENELEEEQEPLEPVLSKEQMIVPEKEASKFKQQIELDLADEASLSEKEETLIERMSDNDKMGSGTDGLALLELASNESPLHVVQMDISQPKGEEITPAVVSNLTQFNDLYVSMAITPKAIQNKL